MKERLVEPIPVQDSSQIDCDRHAVIEASAGTGKTYTIEHLVADLLRKGRVGGLDEICVVTYTEKAACELRERIRTNILRSFEQEPSDLLRTALDTFDSASIFTIHGFCNKVLQEYAFENGEQFQHELTDDRVAYRKALMAIMREDWPRRYGARLGRILEFSRFPGSTAGGTSSWMERVIDLAMRFQPPGNDALVPSGDQDIPGLMSAMEAEARSVLDALLSMAGVIEAPDVSASELCARYETLNIRKNSIKKRVRILSSLLRLLAAHRERPATLNQLSDFLSDEDVSSIEFSDLDSGWNKSGADYEEKLPRLPDIIAHLERLRSLDLAGVRAMLTAETVRALKRCAAERKESEGLISYDDMVTRVHAAISAGTGSLKRVLQKRYRYALVDEFQDTDMLQWKIFSMLFLESDENRLFIIGDPKQAIYGFRGADIHAYYTARDEMIARHGARYYCLNENWRSSPALIRCYNGLFADGNWFADSAIRYRPSQYPAEKRPDAHTDSSSLVLVRCGTVTGGEAKSLFADFIARELSGIIAKNPATDLNDIAVLVTKWKEAEAVEMSLRRAHVRYSFYKKEGLYQSRESLEISYLIAAIAKPNDLAARKRALVTRFFGVPLGTLGHYDAIAPGHPVSLLFEYWAACASTKQWPRMFQSFMEDTGILYRLEPAAFDRTVINYRSILQNLEVESYRNNYCIQEIADCLNGLRTGDSASHDSYNIQSIDIDRPGVQLLTIHASKGLEFSTVFIAGGFTRGVSPDYWTYHRDGRKTFDLVMDQRNREHYETELAGEEERLFYVAFTRARDRLYVPVFEPTTRALGTSGILGRKIFGALKALPEDSPAAWIDCGAPGAGPVPEPAVPAAVAPVSVPDPLLPDPALQFLERRQHIDSFSGLKEKLLRRRAPERPFSEFGDPAVRSGEDDAAGAAAANPPTPADAVRELPRSRETGLMLHQVLERISFRRVMAAATPEILLAEVPGAAALIDAAIRDQMNVPVNDDILPVRKEAARIIWNTLHAQLDDAGLVLGNIEDRQHEVEFYYPAPLSPPTAIPGTSCANSFIHGYIDMIVSFGEKLYIVDWKSNHIEQGYSRESLERNILDMHYDLQISIYTAAVLRWLRSAVPGFSYDRHFGGVFYLYLRGMNPAAPGNGIFFTRPADEQEAMKIPHFAAGA